MGVSVDSGDKKAVNVELNVVPFIDLMSCLTAFLLVTAVWSQFAQINIKPKGLGKDAQEEIDETLKVHASILLTENQIFVGLTVGDRREIRNDGSGYDWQGLEDTLKGFKEMPAFADRQDIEIAAEDNVAYQTVISAMDTAIAASFKDIGFVDPQSLSVKFKE
jgi:biopolymer transport protein ExbD